MPLLDCFGYNLSLLEFALIIFAELDKTVDVDAHLKRIQVILRSDVLDAVSHLLVHIEQVEVDKSLLHFARENASYCAVEELRVFLLQEEVKFMAEELREMFLFVILGHLEPLEDEIELCELLERTGGGDALLLIQFVKDFLGFLEIVDNLNLGRNNVLNEVFISLSETVGHSGLRQSLL